MAGELAAQAQTVGAYLGGFAFLLGVVDRVIQWRHSNRADSTTDMDITLQRGAQLREELRKDAEALRTRLEHAEKELQACEVRLAVSEQKRSELEIAKLAVENERDDLRAELRLLRRGTREADRD